MQKYLPIAQYQSANIKGQINLLQQTQTKHIMVCAAHTLVTLSHLWQFPDRHDYSASKLHKHLVTIKQMQ